MGRVVAAAVYSKGLKVSTISLDEGKQWAKKPGHFVWIGLHDPGSEELSNLQRQFDLHELALEDALQRHTRPDWRPLAMPCFWCSIRPFAPMAS